MQSSKITELDYKLLKQKYSSEELESFIKKIEEEDYPVQYAIGNVDFISSNIDVDERVLIPRFATELLVYKLVKRIKDKKYAYANILDICTGSGCIAIELQKFFKNYMVYALDISEDALELAKKNAKKNKLQIDFKQMDILKEVPLGKYSVIVANPPYVREDEEVSANTKYEPRIALYPGDDDIIFYKRIIDISKDILEDEGIIAFEIGSEQKDRISSYIKKRYPKAKIDVEKDYEGYDRFIFINF